MSDIIITRSTTSKPCHRFVFPDQTSAEQFYSFAYMQENTTRVQYPFDVKERVSQNLKEVYVNTSGSHTIDASLLQLLIAKAESLKGHYEPKV